ncbi:hypothetical protein HOC01_00305 [archaeon]|jgi:hypothetical protein|nr:hypothetical protein [archaeon]MBT6698719.1 hypothetical protein [archaeon]
MAKRKLKNKVVKKTTKKSKAKNKSSKTKPKSKSSSKKLTTKKELQILESEMKTVLGRTQRIQTNLKSIKKLDKKLQEEELQELKKQKEIKQEEKKIEKQLLKVGNFTFKRRHLLELIRGTAGAFLGVGLGKSLLSFETLAQTLPWINIIGILIFILAVSALLIYKNEHDFIKKEGFIIVPKRLIFLYTIAIVIEVLSLYLFGGLPSDPSELIKWLIIGSYPAMAGAVSFSMG